MGVYIPNMEKPKECKKCKFCIVEAKVEGKIYPLNAYCFVQNQNIKDFTDCPLIEIPTPHGRLIDGDALETVFKDMAKCEWNQKVFPISWAYAFEDTIDEIHDAPTILEAEGR